LRTRAAVTRQVDATNATNALVDSTPASQDAFANANLLPSLHTATADREHSLAATDAATNLNDSPRSPIDNVMKSTPIAPWQERKERNRKRLLDSLEKETLPDYRVKRSKKWPLQQRAVEWMTQAAKQHFDRHFSTILAQWGVKESHKGTCVLLPADWAALDPLRLAGLFNAENCPRAWADGVVSNSFLRYRASS
jgi:hypothetical protein